MGVEICLLPPGQRVRLLNPDPIVMITCHQVNKFQVDNLLQGFEITL